MTSDNASNNNTLNDTLNEAIAWLNRKLNLQRTTVAQIPCLAHVIQLAVQQLTSKIHINAKNDEITKNWIEEDELGILEEAAQGEETVITRVS